MYACYKQFHPPTAVSFSLSAHFTSSKDENLILIKNNVMEIYVVKKHENNPEEDEVNFKKNWKYLVLIKTFELFGVIDSIVAVTLPGRTKDVLLINFEDEAKVSVVEFDEKRNDLRTCSLHYFEDDFLKEGRTRFVYNQPIKLDPHNRFASVIIYDSKLVILPFKQVSENHSQEENFLFQINKSSTTAVNNNNLINENEMKSEVQRQIIIDLNDLGLRNIKDYCFLNGYNEPTILFLHENEQTWSGRLAVKNNTSTVTAVSFDLYKNYYPIIWSVGSLPHDSYKIVPLEETAGGGVLVFGMNSIIHVNQCATWGLSLNDFAVSNPNLSINFKIYENYLFFDVGATAFISNDKLLVSLKDGELYVLFLEGGGSRINNLQLKKLTSTTPASCMTILPNSLLFLGSRLGDSVLYEYYEKRERSSEEVDNNNTVNDDELYNSTDKKKRKLTTTDKESNNGDSVDDFLMALEQDNDVPNGGNNGFLKGSKIESTKIELRIRNSFMNISPISQLAVVDTTLDTSGYQSKLNDNNLEVVACSGSGRHGCLSVLNRNLRPEVQSDTTLPFKIKQMWTIQSLESDFDEYLILSLENNTKVLESKKALDEVTSKTTFVTDEPTLNISRLTNYIVQVTRTGVRLLDNATKKPTDKKTRRDIKSSAILEPYILLHLVDGTLQLIIVNPGSGTIKLQKVALPEKNGKVAAISMYKAPENSDLFQTTNGNKYFCCVYWTNGTFEIFTVPDFVSVFSFSQFYQFHSTVFDEDINENQSEETEVKNPYVSEMILRSIGDEDELPHLLILLSDGTLHMYRSFICNTAKPKENRLFKLRFTKVAQDSFLPTINIDKKEETKLDITSTKSIFPTSEIQSRSKFIPFSSIGGYGGVFFSGDKPFWFFTEYGHLRLHPMLQDKTVTGFTPYHNANCHHGFIYFLEKDSKFKICTLSETTKYNAFLPTRRVMLKATPNVIAFHQETKSCLVCTAVAMKAILPEDRQLPIGRFPPAIEQKHTAILFSGHDWVEMDKFEFELHECVLASKVVYLSKEEYNDDTDISFEEPLNSKKQDLVSVIAVGTAFVQGERELCRGRLLLFDLEPVLGKANHYKLSLMNATNVKGPITSIAQVDRYILVSVGNRLYTYYYDMKDKRMNITSFYDTHFYTVGINTVRNFILYGDIYKSVSFLRWKEKGHRLILLAKDNKPLQVLSSEFLINGHHLGAVVADTNRNIQIFAYDPKDPESNDGRNLVPVCDFRVGALINSWVRMKMRDIPGESTVSVLSENEKRRQQQQQHSSSRVKTNPNQQFLLFGCLDGAIGYLAPINESTYRRLSVLQTKMYTQLEHLAGLHPKAYRLYKPFERTEHNYKKKVIDGQLVWLYAHLNTIAQKDLARQIGTNAENILRNIQELYQSTFFF